MSNEDNILLDYEQVIAMCQQLENEAIKYSPDLIVGIKRGGLIPAVHLSHKLQLPMEVLTWQTREVDCHEHNEKIAEVLAEGGKVLFVDDINDSGKTIKSIRNHYNNNNCIFMTLVEKTTSAIKVEESALRIDDERWLVFPWEAV